MADTGKTSYFTDTMILSDKALEALAGDNGIYDAEIARRKGKVTTTTPEVTTPEVTTDETLNMSSGLRELTSEIGKENIPEDAMDMLHQFQNPSIQFGLFGKAFGERDPESQRKKLDKIYRKLQKGYGSDPNVIKILDYLDKMRFMAGTGQQLSSSQYLINQQKNLGITNPWLNAMPGVQVAGTDLTGMGIPNALQQQRQQAELMHAGNLALNQTPSQVAAQVAASQATQQGNYQAPTMTQQQMVEEAIKTGGTVNPHEATKAVYVPPPSQPVSGPHGGGGGGQGGGGGGQSSRPRNSPSSQQSSYSNVRRYGRADGGMVSIMDLLNRRV